MATEDRFHVKFIIEHTDRPAEIEFQSGNHSTDFFRQMWSYLNKMESSHLHHRCISSLRWGILDANRREVSYIVRFVPLKRFEVTMFLDGERELPPIELHTDNAAEILPWVTKQGRRIVLDSVIYYACKGFTCSCLVEEPEDRAPERLSRIMATFPEYLQRWETYERKRVGKTYEAMFIQFQSEAE